MAALCGHAVALTRDPAAIREADLAPLRAVGLDDRAIVDANQVVAYFNYVNRIALGLGVELEDRYAEQAHHASPYGLAERRAEFPTVSAGALPWISVEQMRAVDRAMMGQLGITLEQMMENAGRSLAVLARAILGGDIAGRRIHVLTGSGGNGGGGLVAARHLAVAGAQAEVFTGASAARLSPVTSKQRAIVEAMGVPVRFAAELEGVPELVIDAILGYGQVGPPRDEAANLIRWTEGRRVLALDVPSGLELAGDHLHATHVHATATLTLALPKEGLRRSEAVGDLYVADISVPRSVYDGLGIGHNSPFGRGPIVRIVGPTGP